MTHWRRYLAVAVAVLLVIVAIRVVIFVRHRAATPPTPVPATMAPGGGATVYVIDKQTMVGWLNTDSGSLITIAAIQGLVNRGQSPWIFLTREEKGTHDLDWLKLLSDQFGVNAVTKPDSSRHIDKLEWYLQEFRSTFQGYVLFDGAGSQAEASPNLALSLAGILDAVPINKSDQSLVQAAKSQGLTQVADMS